MAQEKLVVANVTINRNDERVRNVKNIEDIRKLDIFSHLSDNERSKAETELLEKLNENPISAEEEKEPED